MPHIRRSMADIWALDTIPVWCVAPPPQWSVPEVGTSSLSCAVFFVCSTRNSRQCKTSETAKGDKGKLDLEGSTTNHMEAPFAQYESWFTCAASMSSRYARSWPLPLDSPVFFTPYCGYVSPATKDHPVSTKIKPQFIRYAPTDQQPLLESSIAAFFYPLNLNNPTDDRRPPPPKMHLFSPPTHCSLCWGIHSDHGHGAVYQLQMFLLLTIVRSF